MCGWDAKWCWTKPTDLRTRTNKGESLRQKQTRTYHLSAQVVCRCRGTWPYLLSDHSYCGSCGVEKEIRGLSQSRIMSHPHSDTWISELASLSLHFSPSPTLKCRFRPPEAGLFQNGLQSVYILKHRLCALVWSGWMDVWQNKDLSHQVCMAVELIHPMLWIQLYQNTV